MASGLGFHVRFPRFRKHVHLCHRMINSRRKSATSSDRSQYCIDLVRKSDHDGYLATLLMPQSARASSFALRAFNVETAAVNETVSERHIGIMRMQFWKDALTNIYEGSPPQQPVAMELYRAVHKYKLSKRWLTRILEARIQTLDGKQFQSVEEVEMYAENTSSTLLYLLLETLGVQDVNADHVANHIGKAQGIVTMLRAIPYLASKRQTILPTDVLIKHNISQEDILRQSTEQPVKDVIYDIASSAHVHLARARSFNSSVPSDALPVFLATAAIESYLRRLQKVNFDVFHKNCLGKDSLLPLIIWLQNKRKKY